MGICAGAEGKTGLGLVSGAFDSEGQELATVVKVEATVAGVGEMGC